MRMASQRKQTGRALESTPAPVLGLTWVCLNLLVGWIGISFGHATALSIAIGAFDGMVVSVIVVAKVSQKFQAGMTGLLGGFSLDSLTGSSSSVVAKVAQTIHAILDTMQLLPGTESVHDALQASLIQGLWTAVVVVVAALLVKWAQDATCATLATRAVSARLS